MPVRDSLMTKLLPSEATLQIALKAELEAPKAKGEPVIVIERPNIGTTHLYVIWSRWGRLDQMVRSRIIMDAFEEAKGQAETAKVTVAMGLTRAEAKRLGVG